LPEHCVTTRCIDCESHAIIGGKLDCNYMNRLGLSQPTVESFLEPEKTPEQIDAEIEATIQEQKRVQERMERLRELQKEGEPKKDADLPKV